MCFWTFFSAAVATLLDHVSGPLSTLDLAHETKLCKDIEGRRSHRCDFFPAPIHRDLARAGRWDIREQQAARCSAAPATCVLRTGAAEMWKNKVNPYFPAAWKKLLKDGRGRKKVLQIHPREIPSFRDHDLFWRVHYLCKKASVLPNQLKGADRMEGLKNKCAADKSV